MDDTSLSLINRLRNSNETESWNRLVQLYQPLLRAWLIKYDVQESDADDLVQEVLLAVAKDLRQFDHDGQEGSFRAWLKAILVNRLRNFWRTRDRRHLVSGDLEIDRRLAELEDPHSQLSQRWNREHDQHVLRQLLAIVRPQFAESTWQAFRRVALEGVRADDVAKELQLSLNAVFVAKSRVLSRLRQEAEGLVQSSSGFLAGR